MSKKNNNLNLNNSFKSVGKFNSLSNTNTGLLSGSNIKTGTNNVTIGYKSLVKDSNDKNSIVIGCDAIGQGDNIAVIGNTNIESIQSGTDGLCNLGGITKNFKNIYTKNVNISDNLYVGDDIRLISDSSVLSFGTDSDTTLTHTDGTGLTLNSDNKLCFRDSNIHISSDDDGYMNIQADTGVNINIGGTDKLAITGSIATFGTNIVIPDSGTIGSASDTNAISISSDGNIGIGTSSPDRELSIYTNKDYGGVTIKDDTSLCAVLAREGVSGAGYLNIWGSGTTQNIYLTGNPNLNSWINTGKFFGIGTDSPQTTLDVNGATALGGTLDVAGTTTLNDNVTISATTVSSSTNTGALTVAGGVGISKDLYVGEDVHITGSTSVTTLVSTGTTILQDLTPTLSVRNDVTFDSYIGNEYLIDSSSNNCTITLPTVSIGSKIKFIIENTGNTIQIKANSGHLLKGYAIMELVPGSSKTIFKPDGTDDLNITLNGSTTGGFIGDRIELTGVSDTEWRVRSLLGHSGTAATPFS